MAGGPAHEAGPPSCPAVTAPDLPTNGRNHLFDGLVDVVPHPGHELGGIDEA